MSFLTFLMNGSDEMRLKSALVDDRLGNMPIYRMVDERPDSVMSTPGGWVSVTAGYGLFSITGVGAAPIIAVNFLPALEVK